MQWLVPAHSPAAARPSASVPAGAAAPASVDTAQERSPFLFPLTVHLQPFPRTPPLWLGGAGEWGARPPEVRVSRRGVCVGRRGLLAPALKGSPWPWRRAGEGEGCCWEAGGPLGLSLEVRPRDGALPPLSPPHLPSSALWEGTADCCARIPPAAALARPFCPPGTQCPTRTAWSPVSPQLRGPVTRPGGPWMPHGPGLSPGGPPRPHSRLPAEPPLPPGSQDAPRKPVPLRGLCKAGGSRVPPRGTVGPQIPLKFSVVPQSIHTLNPGAYG